MQHYGYTFIADTEQCKIPPAMNPALNRLEFFLSGEYERECWLLALSATGCLDARREPPR